MISHEWLAREAFWLWPLLLGHLWQATLFAAFALLAALALKRRAAKTRHTILLVAMLKFIFPSALLAFLAKQLDVDLSPLFGWTNQPAEGAYVISQLAAPLIELIDPVSVEAQPVHNEWLCALTVLWLTGCGMLLGLWWTRRFRLARAIRAGHIVEGGREMAAFERAKSRLAVKRRVRLVRVAHKAEPGVWRTWHPVVVLPEELADHLSDDELEAVMLHELIHVERWDNLASTVQMWVCCVLWFHPLVWLIDRKLLGERERACDERVLETSGFSSVYASSILKVCRFCIGWKAAGVSGVTGSNLRRRIEQIMAYEMKESGTSRHRLLVATMIAAAVVFTITTGLFSRSNVTAQSNSVVDDKMVAVTSESVSNGASVEIVSTRQTKDVTQEVEQAPEVALRFENPGGVPLAISDAKLKVIPLDLLERTLGDMNNAGEVDNASLSAITLKNTINRRVSRFNLTFERNQKAGPIIEYEAVIEPGQTYEFKADWQRIFARQQVAVFLPNAGENWVVKVRGVEFDDGSKWGDLLSPPSPPSPSSAVNLPQPPSPQSAIDPPQPPSPSSTVAPAQPPGSSAVAAPPQPPAPPSTPAGDEEVFMAKDTTTKVVILSRPEPRYTEEAKRNRVNGRVMLTAVFSSSGEVTNIQVVEGQPDGLTESAVEAARQIKFTPAMKDGRSVSQQVRLEYNFGNYQNNPPSQARISAGVLNGRAIQKPVPPYPQEAKDAGVSGMVTVRIVVDEAGKVVEAKAVSGHSLLHQASVDAAHQAQFEPTTLQGQPVKISGVLTYNFVLQK